jgi:hypothetical protein
MRTPPHAVASVNRPRWSILLQLEVPASDRWAGQIALRGTGGDCMTIDGAQSVRRRGRNKEILKQCVVGVQKIHLPRVCMIDSHDVSAPAAFCLLPVSRSTSVFVRSRSIRAEGTRSARRKSGRALANDSTPFGVSTCVIIHRRRRKTRHNRVTKTAT